MKLPELENYFNQSLYEMSNYTSDDTGLSPGTKLWVREEPNNLPHTKYRIKLSHPQYGSAMIAIWGDEPKQVAGNWNVEGKDLKILTTLLQNTHNQIRAHIDGNISSYELGAAFRQTKLTENESI